jgi:catechol 2,3-dioxygenase-like lactoylglutathione lyase family enzyme
VTDVSPLIRAAIFVSDLDKSKRFYMEVLNFREVFFEGDLRDPVVNSLLRVPASSVTRGIVLKQGGPNFGMLGLFEASEPAPPPLEKSRAGCRLGEVCMVFYCSNLEEICKKLARFDAHIISEPKFLRLKTAMGTGQYEMTCRGPDGEMLNLIERDPGEAFADTRVNPSGNR